jgi:hypothetical protein
MEWRRSLAADQGVEQLTAPILEAALLQGCASFAPGELAYLALTSKPEDPIQDRRARAPRSSHPGVIAAREIACARLDEFGTLTSGTIIAGAAFGIATSEHFLVTGAVSS